MKKRTFYSIPPFSDFKNTTGLYLAVEQAALQRRGACSAFITETRFNSFPNERSLWLRSGRGAQFLSAVAHRSAVRAAPQLLGFCSGALQRSPSESCSDDKQR